LIRRGVHFALVYDLVGHDVSVPAEMVPGVGGLLAKVPGLSGKDIAIPHLRNLLFMTGAESHPGLPGLVEGAGMPKKLKLMATLNEYVGDMSDHGVFRRNGVPYLFFSCGRWAHYHMETDTPDRLNYRKMARIALLTADVLVRADSDALAPGEPAADTVEFEARTMQEASGMLYPLLLKWAGVPDLGSRENIGTLVGKMLSAGL
jgi:hypothetical protein